MALTAAFTLLAGCGNPLPGNDNTDSPIQAPGIDTALETAGESGIVELNAETSCYAGPGFGYEPASSLDPGQYFKVIGIDDEVITIDDEVTWFQINPSAFGDPDPPPGADPSSADTYALDLAYRCWVPGSLVDFKWRPCCSASHSQTHSGDRKGNHLLFRAWH